MYRYNQFQMLLEDERASLLVRDRLQKGITKLKGELRVVSKEARDVFGAIDDEKKTFKDAEHELISMKTLLLGLFSFFFSIPPPLTFCSLF